jgi:hypothetical protein
MEAKRLVHELTFGPPDNDVMQELTETIIKSFVEKTDKIFITAVRTMARPPVRGQITKGKLKWRGIELHINNEGLKTTEQLFQRGIPISPIVSLNFPYNQILEMK